MDFFVACRLFDNSKNRKYNYGNGPFGGKLAIYEGEMCYEQKIGL